MDTNNFEDNNNEKVFKLSQILYFLKPALKILIVMATILGIVYPVILTEIGQITMTFQSGGSILQYEGKNIGSKLIAQEFSSPKFFQSRHYSESASTVDPHITPENAFAQIKNVSTATGIHENTLKTLLSLNMEQNKITNGLFFAPSYINVLEVNLELLKQYPEVYSSSFVNIRGEKIE